MNFKLLLVKEDVAQGRDHVLSLTTYRKTQILRHHFGFVICSDWNAKDVHKKLVKAWRHSSGEEETSGEEEEAEEEP